MRTFTPAEASQESGFSLDTLRYYEREGILPTVDRDTAGHRVYTEATLGTLNFLSCLRDTGMPIALLRRYGQLCSDESSLPDRIALLDEHAAAVDEQIARLTEQRDKIHSKRDWYQGELNRRAADVG